MKGIAWLALITLVFLALRRHLRQWIKRTMQTPASRSEAIHNPHKSTPAPISELMISCGKCHLFIPKSDAIQDGVLYFCCEEHRHQYYTNHTS